MLEYSPSQMAFHVETVDEAILNNLKNMFNKRQTDYGIVGVFSSKDEANEAFRKLSVYRDALLKHLS
ncbi:MAG: hypothetical protein MJ184_11010 [Treponema sp.]|uniref:hypothetical protein n=1 Tax=Treponema sp. TaxID=166 RepID=UPI00298E5FFD|nr:hypothetical protein [Treponema sp.]MCQ2601877.1 hypothetical protein [Treponema sp.]